MLSNALMKQQSRILDAAGVDLSAISPRQEYVVRLRLAGKTYAWIGDDMEVSTERIRQVEAKANRRLTSARDRRARSVGAEIASELVCELAARRRRSERVAVSRRLQPADLGTVLHVALPSTEARINEIKQVTGRERI